MIDIISVYIYFSLNLKFIKKSKKINFVYLYCFYIKIFLCSLLLFYDVFVLY